MLEHRGAILGESVSGANAGADFPAQVAALDGELLDFAEWSVEILLHVVGERLERRDVNDLRLRCKAAVDGGAKKFVDADEKGGEGLA